MNRTITAICMALLSVPASAQFKRDGNRPTYEPGPEARMGYTADDLIDAEVRGAGGETIGEIQDMIIAPDGQLRRLLVDVNDGLFATSGQRLAVQWSDLRPGPREDGRVEYFTAPVTRDNIRQYGIFSNRGPSVEGRGREWRANELIGDYVSLQDSQDYGSVVDLVFNRQGKLLMIALAQDVSNGTGIPLLYSRYSAVDSGWDPGDDFVVLPSTAQDVQDILPVEKNSAPR